MDVHERLRQLLKEHGLTRYRLAKICDLSDSTVTNIFKRGNMPTIGTLEIICKGFGITLSQFFADDDLVELTPELKEFFDEWVYLTTEQRQATLQMMRAMKSKK